MAKRNQEAKKQKTIKRLHFGDVDALVEERRLSSWEISEVDIQSPVADAIP